jgi:hypothetical protein
VHLQAFNNDKNKQAIDCQNLFSKIQRKIHFFKVETNAPHILSIFLNLDSFIGLISGQERISQLPKDCWKQV